MPAVDLSSTTAEPFSFYAGFHSFPLLLCRETINFFGMSKQPAFPKRIMNQVSAICKRLMESMFMLMF